MFRFADFLAKNSKVNTTDIRAYTYIPEPAPSLQLISLKAHLNIIFHHLIGITSECLPTEIMITRHIRIYAWHI
jgi:hypothetical protein